jgi:hypothetical protein
MWLFCDCGARLAGYSRPSNRAHRIAGEEIFSSYQHCKKCGASYRADVHKVMVRAPFPVPPELQEPLPIGDNHQPNANNAETTP